MTSNENFYSAENTIQAGWMKFDQVGDSVKGTFVEKFKKEGSGSLPDQVVYVLTNATLDTVECDNEGNITKLVESNPVDGNINVGIKASNSYILTRLKNTMPGDIIGFAFTREIAPKQKGYNPAKSIQVFKAGTDEQYLTSQESKSNTTGDEISVEDIPFR